MKPAQQFFRGWQAVGQGARMLREHPQLVRHAIWPIVLGTLISLVTFGLFLTLAISSISQLHDWFQQDTSGWSRWLWTAIELIVGLLLLALSFGAAAVTWLILYALLLGNALGKVAEEAEQLLGADPQSFQSLTFTQDVSGTLLHLGLIVGVSILSMILNVVPLIGAILAIGLTTYVTWLMLGLEFMSHSLSLRGVTHGQQIRFARKHWSATIGLGSAVLIGQLIPLIGTLLLVCCTIGGVFLHRELAALPGAVQTPRQRRPSADVNE